MKSEALVQRHPPTPPNANVDPQHGLHYIAQFNYEDSQRHGSVYDSPGPQSFQATHIESHPSPSFGLGIRYDGYGESPVYYQQEGHYNGLPNNQAIYPGSPPTPRSATDNDESSRRTRSGRTIAPSSSPVTDKPRPKATPKKKSKAGKSEKPKTPKLTAPLSVLTNHMSSIPVRNMEEWVNRPVEVRRKEVEARNGYVTRPMNSFMLYRSAYAERTKQWCLQNNHQIVSSVSGESWPMEPAEIRDLYNEYAKIERINHQNAHPTYKFSPSKPQAINNKKRKGEFSDDEPSDLDDGEWAPGHGRSRPRQIRRPERTVSYPTGNMTTDLFERQFGPNFNGLNKSAWEMTNDGRPLPMPMGQADLYNQYYQQPVHSSMATPPVIMDDFRLMRRVDTPANLQFSPGHGLLGLPGGNAADMMHHMDPSNAGTPLGDDGQVDPLLLSYDGGQQHHMNPALTQHPEFRNGHLSMIERELDQDSVNSLLPPHDEFHAEAWQSDPNMPQMEQGSEFDKWMDDHTG